MASLLLHEQNRLLPMSRGDGLAYSFFLSFLQMSLFFYVVLSFFISILYPAYVVS